MTDFSLVGLIDEHIAANKVDKEYDSWRASMVGRCPRAHTYLRKGIETKDTTARQERVFEVGHIFHEWIQGIADGQGYATQIEQELYDKELDLGGRYDLLIDADKKILVDIKTVHSGKFTHIADEVSPDYHYQMQLAAYMLMLKRAGNPVDEGRILYVSKDDLRTEERTYLLTPEKEKTVLEELRVLHRHWKYGTLPDCTCDDSTHGTDWQRKSAYCPYATDAYEYATVTSKTGKEYRKKQFTKCCEEALWSPSTT